MACPGTCEYWSLNRARVFKAEGWVPKGLPCETWSHLFSLQQVALLDEAQAADGGGSSPKKTKVAVTSEREALSESSSGVWTSPQRLWGPTRIMRTFSRIILAVIALGGTSHPFCCIWPGFSRHAYLGTPRLGWREPQKEGQKFRRQRLTYLLFWPSCLPWPDQPRKPGVSIEQSSRVTVELIEQAFFLFSTLKGTWGTQWAQRPIQDSGTLLHYQHSLSTHVLHA